VPVSETEAKKPTKLNSRWRKGAARYSTKTTVEHTRHIRTPEGVFRREQDSPIEAKYVERMHAAPGWRNGARITKRGN
jgi:hypothetical protein